MPVLNPGARHHAKIDSNSWDPDYSRLRQRRVCSGSPFANENRCLGARCAGIRHFAKRGLPFVHCRAGGTIKILQNGAVLPTPFLDLSQSVNTEGERGLLGMAFDPKFATNHRFYVDYIDKSTLNTVVATYQADISRPNIANAASGQTVLTVTQPPGLSNHKAGWIGFRPGEPNNLYIATGDGGGGQRSAKPRAKSQ